MRVGDIDVFLLGAGRPARGVRPSALQHINLASCALDWQQSAFCEALDNPEIHFLGGYQVQSVIRKYPQLNFTVVADWAGQSILHTLLAAPFRECPAIVSYSDTVFRPQVIRQLLDVPADVVVCVDSLWRRRYADRTNEDLKSAETIDLAEHSSKQLQSDPHSSTVEFTGLMLLRQSAITRLDRGGEQAIGSNLLDAIDYLVQQDLIVEFVDAEGEWAEFNAPADIAHFVLGTKAETLARLESVVTKSTIGRQVAFSVNEWLRAKAGVLDKITSAFPATPLIVRSSAKSEDGWSASLAGSHESVLGVPSDNADELAAAIDSVVDSYSREGSDDQVLVQAMLQDVACSGVVFTRALETGGPYYRINFDDESLSTESVTSGTGRALRTIIVSRQDPVRINAIEPALGGLMEAVIELEELLDYDKLDIEFAINSAGDVHIFQVRPITVDHSEYEVEEAEIFDSLDANRVRFDELQARNPFTAGERTIFGVMPDWNPAEIIGTRPGALAYSLYRYLITDEVWAQQRAEFGYRDVRPHKLIVSFSGQPYVDIRASLNSFVPASVSDDCTTRLVDAYLERLDRNRDLHDKLEFDVAFTVLGPCFQKNVEERLPAATEQDRADIAELRQGLHAITSAAFTRLAADTAPVERLAQRLKQIETSSLTDLQKAIALLEDCRRYGTPAFAHAARAGFVATTFLNDFVALGIMSEAERQQFLGSVRTVTTDFEEDLQRLNNSEVSLDEVVATYGHLRPGTYDITVPSYREAPERYLLGGEKKQTAHVVAAFEPSDELCKKVVAVLAELDFEIEAQALFAYMREAIRAREQVKFDFSRNLSLALDCLLRFGEQHDIAREELAHLAIDDFRDAQNGVIGLNDLRQLIELRKHRARISQMVELPEVIADHQDMICYEQRRSQPNFVTTQSVDAPCVHLEAGVEEDLYGKILFISQADPGYDWVFVHGIAGLITQYGGANSHMAIRSAELGIPAAIGVGDKLFDALSRSRRIRLDCGARKIEVVSG